MEIVNGESERSSTNPSGQTEEVLIRNPRKQDKVSISNRWRMN